MNNFKKSFLIANLFSTIFFSSYSQGLKRDIPRMEKRNIYGMKKYTFSSGLNAYRFNNSKLNSSYGIFPNLEFSFTKGLPKIGDLETSISYDSKHEKGANRYESDANLDFLRVTTSLKDFLFLNKPPQEKRFHFGVGAHYTKLSEDFFLDKKRLDKRDFSTFGFFGLLEYDIFKEINLNENKIFNLSLRFSSFLSLKDKKTDLSSGGFLVGAKLKLYNPF